MDRRPHPRLGSAQRPRNIFGRAQRHILMRSNGTEKHHWAYAQNGAPVNKKRLHIPPVLAADLVHRFGDLTERAVFGGFHDGREDVAIADGCRLHLF